MDFNLSIFVSIYCKIYCDNFSAEMINRVATGNEIYQFLMKDAGQCFDEDDSIIPGDCNIWYLGCNEKFGHLAVEDKVWKWSFGESSFDTIELFVSTLYQKKIISGVQFHSLMAKIDEGRQIDNMYSIQDYLICKREGIAWDKTPDAGKFRDDIQCMVDEIKTSLENNGYRVFL